MRNQRGLSAIVITVILIALSMVAIALVWGFVNNMVKGQIDKSESCFGNYEKIKINGEYTCYDTANSIFRFSLMIEDINADKVTVSVSSAGSVKSYEITNTAEQFTELPYLLTMYSGATPANVILPGKNSGLTYNATGFTSVDRIQIMPTIGGNVCSVADSLSDIQECSSL